jgi:undecaprenyl-diphosphatase
MPQSRQEMPQPRQEREGVAAERGGAAGGGFLRTVQSFDESLTAPLTLPPRRGAAQVVALGLAHSGDIYIWAVLLAAAWFFGDSQWKARALITISGLVLTEIVVVIIKNIFRRKRPPGTSGAIYRRADPYSFPSGHAARAVMLCILSWQLGPVAAFVVVMAWSPIMVLSRIAIGIHYVFDVIAGIVLGVLLTAVLLAVAPLIAARL